MLALARALPARAFQTVTWGEGERGEKRSRFAAVSVRSPVRPGTHNWLLIEWPQDCKEPERYWLSNLPRDTPLAQLVELAKLRWQTERAYEDLNQEIGLNHFEGRSWRGFHHHVSLCIAAYGFLVRERGLFFAQHAQNQRAKDHSALAQRSGAVSVNTYLGRACETTSLSHQLGRDPTPTFGPLPDPDLVALPILLSRARQPHPSRPR